MGSERYPEKPLVELASIHDSMRVPVKKSQRTPGPFPYYGASGITDYVHDYLFDGDYVLLAEDGDNLRTQNTPIAFMARGRFWVNNHAHILKGKDGNDTDFICYALQIADVSSYISGSTRPKITQADMKRIPIFAPTPKQQKEIVNVLRSLDKKIELNRQTNQTLESMAQALFKSWFVDFDPVIDNALAAGNEIPEPLAAKAAARRALREQGADKAKQLHTLPEHIRKLFPSRFQFTEELGWIPEGWQTGTLSSVTTELRRGISPKYVDEGGVRVINQRCIRDHIINVGPSRQHDAAQRKVDGRLLSVGDVLVNSTGVGTLGRIAQVYELNEATVVDSHVTVVRPSVDYFKPYVFGRLMFSIESAVEALGTGSTGQTELSRSDLGNLNVVIPPAAAQNATEGLLKYFADRIAFNLKQSETLELARDTLLPKLLSGELRIPEVKKELDEALA